MCPTVRTTKLRANTITEYPVKCVRQLYKNGFNTKEFMKTEYPSLKTDKLIIQEASKDSRYKNKARRGCYCIITTAAISSVARGVLGGVASYYQLVYGYGYIGSTWDLAITCIFSETVGAVAGGAIGGLLSGYICLI